MEAAAIPAGAGQAGAEGAAEQGAEGGQQPGLDMDAVMGRMNEALEQGFQGLQQGIEQRLPPPAEEAEPEPEYDLDALYGAEGEMDPERAQEVLQQMIDTRAEQKARGLIDAEVGPLREGLEEFRVEREGDALLQQFPDLADPQVNEVTFSRAAQIVQGFGVSEEMGNRLMNSAGFISLVHTANLAEQQQAGQSPGAGQQLEPGGGGSPAAAAPDFAAGLAAGPRGNGHW